MPKAGPGISMLEIAKAIAGKVEVEIPPPRKPLPPRSKADDDYVSPTAKEITRVFEEIVSIKELSKPRSFTLPENKKVMLTVLKDVDPFDRISERVTLHRLLKAKKVSVTPTTPTLDMVQMAMKTGCFGRQNKRG